VDIVEEEYRSKIGQRLAYPDSIFFSCYQVEWKDLTNECLSRAGCMQQALDRLETRSAALGFLGEFPGEAQESGHDFLARAWGLPYR
jgi:hypothetical protein